jgi:hypothetical protein
VSATAAASFTLEAVDRLRTIVGVIDVIIFLGIEPALSAAHLSIRPKLAPVNGGTEARRLTCHGEDG